MKGKLFSTCGPITHSASICLMTHFRCRQLWHTPSICLTWPRDMARTYSGERFTCLPGLPQKFFHISRPMAFKIHVCKKVKNQVSFTPFRNKKSRSCISVFIFKQIWQCKNLEVTLWLCETNDADALRHMIVSTC